MRLVCLVVVVSSLMATSASAAPRPGASGRNYKKVCGAVPTGICPNYPIRPVEASSNSFANLGAAEDYAAAHANAVSNSYGGGEFFGETASTYEGHYNLPGVAITVSSGDNGYGVEFPAASRYVTAVGGTTLVRDSRPRGWGETVWSGAGSGCSAYVPKPAWQTDTGCARRTAGY